ncbi:MAG: hypothetical protein GXO65_07135 [Euryarchaeota archaeon]|nr:hypothetical protein [Euryarchaeota archaeon]
MGQEERRAGSGGIYVIQEHHAARLHWDLRLEMDGVLKSWAVPKEPPREKGVKRLCIQTEDHPLEYADFGEIPEGRYGAGIVKTWDRGTFRLEDRKPDKLVFDIRGEKLKGRYVLLRFKKAGEGNWLFFRT